MFLVLLRRHRRGTRGEKGSTQNESTTTTEGLRAGRAGEASAREGTDVIPPHQHDVLVDDDDVNPEEPPQGSKTTPSDYPKREANSWKQITVTTHNVQGCNNDQKEKKDMIANLLCCDMSPAVYLLLQVRKHTKFKIRRLLTLGGTGH